MIGTVNAGHEITVRVPIMDGQGQPSDLVAVLDTGYSGHLTLPSAVIGALGLAWFARVQLVLGSGQVEEFDQYTATVLWDGQPRAIFVQAVETMPLLGMKLLVGHDLRARVAPGGDVEITPIP
jgi:predicted aspartyl protease